MPEPTQEKKDVIVSTASYFPIIGAIALGYGIINQAVYYLIFNINILEFTDLSELLLNTLHHLIVIALPATFVTLLSVFIINKTLDKIYNNLNETQLIEMVTNNQRDPASKKKVNYVYYFLALALLIFHLGMAFYRYHYLHKFDGVSFLFDLGTVFFLTIFLLFSDFFSEIYTMVFGKKIDKALYGLLISSLVLLTISIEKALKNGADVKNHSTLNFYVINDKDTIKSTPTHYYIGRTKGFFFFYNDSTKFTDVYADKDAKVFHIK